MEALVQQTVIRWIVQKIVGSQLFHGGCIQNCQVMQFYKGVDGLDNEVNIVSKSLPLPHSQAARDYTPFV